jgi:hypothetical protein
MVSLLSSKDFAWTLVLNEWKSPVDMGDGQPTFPLYPSTNTTETGASDVVDDVTVCVCVVVVVVVDVIVFVVADVKKNNIFFFSSILFNTIFFDIKKR